MKHKLEVCVLNVRWKIKLLLLGFILGPVSVAESFALPKRFTSSRLEFGLEQSEYLTDSYSSEESNSYTRFFSQFKFSTGKDFHGTYGDLRWAVIDGESVDQLIGAPELYYHVSSDDDIFHLEAGRIKKNWSLFDQYWSFGTWQPTLNWSDVLGEQQGLTGIFLTMRVRQVKLMGFVSGIFLPNQGGAAKVKDGKVISQDRWYNDPITQLEFSGENSEIYYELQELDYQKIASQWSYGFQIEVGSTEREGFLLASISSKPLNQLYIGIDGSHDISDGPQGLTTVVQLHPLVARHKVGTIEAGFSGQDYRFYSSMTYDRPEEPNIDERWIKTPLLSSTLLGAGLSVKGAFGAPGEWSMGYMRTISEERIFSDELVGDAAANAFERVPYDEAWSFRWKVRPGNWRFNRLGLGMRYLYAPTVKGSLLSGSISFLAGANWQTFFNFDVVGSQGGTQGEYFYRNQGNDRLQAGLSYVF